MSSPGRKMNGRLLHVLPGFTACAEFLLDIAPLFMLLKGLIGCPVFCVFVIGSYKTQRFISLVQALPSGSVLNESDKGV